MRAAQHRAIIHPASDVQEFGSNRKLSLDGRIIAPEDGLQPVEDVLERAEIVKAARHLLCLIRKAEAELQVKRALHPAVRHCSADQGASAKR